jgi:hypothetical protein
MSGEDLVAKDEEEVTPLVDLSKPYGGRIDASVQTLDKYCLLWVVYALTPCRYISDFIVAARKRVSVLRKRHAASNPDLFSDPDESDAKAIAKAQENVLEAVTAENCAHQPDGKARCGLTWCNKLFKGQDFLMKHIRNKHIDLALVRLVRVSEQYMMRRFSAEDICKRPLAPIEVEVGGGLEQKTIKEVYESANARLADGGPIPTLPNIGGNRGSRGSRGRDDFRRDSHPRDRERYEDHHDRRNSGEFVRRPRDDRRESEVHLPRDDRRDENRESRRRESAPASFVEYVPPRAEDNNSRRLQSYVDIDSPMVRRRLSLHTILCQCLVRVLEVVL